MSRKNRKESEGPAPARLRMTPAKLAAHLDYYMKAIQAGVEKLIILPFQDEVTGEPMMCLCVRVSDPDGSGRQGVAPVARMLLPADLTNLVTLIPEAADKRGGSTQMISAEDMLAQVAKEAQKKGESDV